MSKGVTSAIKSIYKSTHDATDTIVTDSPTQNATCVIWSITYDATVAVTRDATWVAIHEVVKAL